MTKRLEDLSTDEQVERMEMMSQTISDIIKAAGGRMLLQDSRMEAAKALKTTVDQVDYGVVYGESTHKFNVPNSGLYITA